MHRITQLLVIFIVVVALYSPILSVYFSHDDFFHFKASLTDGSSGEFARLFRFPTFEERGYGFYRPIFREGLHNLYYNLFGLNHLPFRIVSLFIHLVNIGLVYLLMQKLFKRLSLSFFTAFFFGITAGNVGSLYYLAGGIQSLGTTMFMLATLLLFWEWLGSKKNKFIFLSIIAYLLSLASHELAVVTPLLLVGLLFIRKRLKDVKTVVPFFVVLLIFLYLDFFHIGFSSSESQYKLAFSGESILNSFGWYTAWALGIPEMFIDFVGAIGPGFSINPNLMRYWGDYAVGIFFFGGFTAVLLVLCTIYAMQNKILRDRRFWFLLFWFPVALSPVILLPFHKSTYYLNPALPAFWGLLGIIVFSAYEFLSNRKKQTARIMTGMILASLFLLSVTSVRLADKTYPAANRGRIAQKLIDEVKGRYPALPKGATVYFKNDPSYPAISGDWGGSSKQAAFALNGSDALQLLYKDPTLRVIYEGLGGIVEPDMYILVARIN